MSGAAKPAAANPTPRPPIISAIIPAFSRDSGSTAFAISETPALNTNNDTPTSIMATEPNVIVKGIPVIIPAS